MLGSVSQLNGAAGPVASLKEALSQVPWDQGLNLAGIGLLMAILAGLVVRRRLTRLPSWTVYVVAIVSWQLLTTIWRARYFKLANWAAYESLAVLSTLWIALELAHRIAGRLPGARRVLAFWLAVILSATVAFIAMTPLSAEANWPRLLGFALLPRLNVGIAASFCAVGGVAALYAVPLDRLHRSVLVGMTVYILVFVVILDHLNIAWIDRIWMSRASATSYDLIACTWVAAAWRRGEVMAPIPAHLKKLWWPWAPPR